MASQDAFLGTRQEDSSLYQEEKTKWGTKTWYFWKVWDGKLKKYKYIISDKKEGNVYSYMYFYAGRKLYGTLPKGEQSPYPYEMVDGDLITLYPVTKTMRHKIIGTMWDKKFWWHL